MHRACKAGINTPGLNAMATLDRKGNLYITLYTHTRHRMRSLSFKCLDYVLRLRVFHATINLAQSATDTDLFLDIYSSHVPNSS
jgi:hypothetical protein